MSDSLDTVTFAYVSVVLAIVLGALGFYARSPKRFAEFFDRLLPEVYSKCLALCSTGLLASVAVFAGCLPNAIPLNPAGRINAIFTHGAVMTGELFVAGLVLLLLLPRFEDAVWGVPGKAKLSDADRRSPIRPFVLAPVFFVLLFVPVCAVNTASHVIDHAAGAHLFGVTR